MYIPLDGTIFFGNASQIDKIFVKGLLTTQHQELFKSHLI